MQAVWYFTLKHLRPFALKELCALLLVTGCRTQSHGDAVPQLHLVTRLSLCSNDVLLPARKRFRFRFKQYFQYLLWKNWNVGHLLQGEESIRKSTELNLILLNLGSIKHGWIHWSNTKGKLDNTKVLNSRERITRVKFCNLRHMYGHIFFFRQVLLANSSSPLTRSRY